jgi:protein-L-isoaspartate(D-aspartate) O-methyltransferase
LRDQLLLVTYFDERGAPASSSSQPALVAEMLEPLELASGMGVLEVGAGTGYNAALLAAITGASVVTIDTIQRVVEEARAALGRLKGSRRNYAAVVRVVAPAMV